MKQWAHVVLWYLERVGPWLLFAVGVYAIVFALTGLFLL